MISEAKLKQLYSTMLRCRILGERTRGIPGQSSSLVRQAGFVGSEASAVGAAIDLRRDDWLVPAHPDTVCSFIKGVPLATIVARSQPGRSAPAAGFVGEPSSTAQDGSLALHIFSSAMDVAAQINLAAGVALAIRAKKTSRIVMAFCGHTALSATAREAMRVAGSHRLPLVVLIHLRAGAGAIKRGAGAADMLAEAHTGDYPTIVVDDQDVVAMHRVAHESIHKARHGGGPTLIAAKAFRLNAGIQVEASRSRESPDGIDKMEAYLSARGLFSSGWKQRLIDRFNNDLDLAMGAAVNTRSRRATVAQRRY